MTDHKSLRTHLLKYGGEWCGTDKLGRDVINFPKTPYTIFLLDGKNETIDLFMSYKKLKSGEAVAITHRSTLWPKDYHAIDCLENFDRTKGSLRFTEDIPL